MTERRTIAIDVMSGDRGPSVCVPAALSIARDHGDLALLLVGDPSRIADELRRHGGTQTANLTIYAASEVIAMNASPRDALRGTDSSMRRAVDLVKSRRASACVSAGNTGALSIIGHSVLKSAAAGIRPALVATLPGAHGQSYMLDVGASSTCTVDQLLSFARMGSVVACEPCNPRPRIGLLNIGVEDIKGHAIVQAAHRALEESGLEYAGYVEGNDLLTSKVDVVVTDGFTGNIALKSMEGLARMIGAAAREELDRTPLRRLLAASAWSALRALRSRFDPRRYNGASLVGLNGVVVKSHGGADELAFAQAILTAVAQVQRDIPARITAALGVPEAQIVDEPRSEEGITLEGSC